MADNDFYGDLSSSSEGSDIINDTTESDISVSSSDSDDGRNGSEYEHLSADDEDRLPGFGRGRRVTGRRGPGRPPKARRGRGRVGRGGEDVPQDVGHGYQADMEDVDDPADIAPADIAPVADPAAIAPVAPGIYIFFHSICI